MIGNPFDELIEVAKAAAAKAYVPYSNYRVGAAARTDGGTIVFGCNVENASYGLTLCAECGLVSQLIERGGGKITHFVCTDENGNVIVPCGRCRQLLREHAAPQFISLIPGGTATMDELLPASFGPEWLERKTHGNPSH